MPNNLGSTASRLYLGSISSARTASSELQSSSRGARRSAAVLVTIGDPDVGDGRRSQFLSKVFANPAARDAVLNPELANAFVTMGKRKSIRRFGMRKTGGVEIDAVAICLCPILPGR